MLTMGSSPSGAMVSSVMYVERGGVLDEFAAVTRHYRKYAMGLQALRWLTLDALARAC